MSDQAPEAGAEQVDGGNETVAPTIDLTPVNERFDRIEQTLGQFAQNLQPPAEEDPAGGIDPNLLAAFGLDPQEYADQYAQPEPQMDPAALQTAIQSQIQQAISPYQQQVQAMQLESMASQLESKYPQLQDPAIAGPVVERTTSMAQQLVQTMGLPAEMVNQIRQNPVLIENAYLAHQAASGAVDEASAQPNHTTLENPSGAGPEGSEPSFTDRMLSARKGNSFWGV